MLVATIRMPAVGAGYRGCAEPAVDGREETVVALGRGAEAVKGMLSGAKEELRACRISAAPTGTDGRTGGELGGEMALGAAPCPTRPY